MINYKLNFLLLFISLIYLLNIKFFSRKLKLIDYAKNKSHIFDTPKYGFIFFILILIPLFTNTFKDIESNFNSLIFSIYISLFLILGYLDDLYNLSVNKRIIFALLLSLTFFIYFKDLFYVSIGFPSWLNILLLTFFTLGFVHLINITDGINGLIISLYVYSLIYFSLKINFQFTFFQENIILTSFILSPLFILANFMGKCFMGNTGSYLVAIIISLIYIEIFPSSKLEYSDILSIYFVPLLDGLRVTIMRVLDKRSPFVGDLSHLHHIVKKRKIYTFFFFVIIFFPSIFNFFFQEYSLLIFIIFFIVYCFFLKFLSGNKLHDNPRVSL